MSAGLKTKINRVTTAACSAVNCPIATGQSRLAHRFGIGGMGVAGAGQVFSGGAKFHRHADFMDQISLPSGR